MLVSKHLIQACCGGTSIVFKTNRPITVFDIEALVKLGFKEASTFTKAGILYVENQALVVSGPIGSDRLKVRCKIEDYCTEKVNDFEVLLQKLG